MRTKSNQTILLWMWHPFEDEQTKGGIVVEQVTVSGQVVCSGQPCIGVVLCFPFVCFLKCFTLSIRPLSPSTMRLRTCPQLPVALFFCKCVVKKSPSDLYMISIKVANSFLAQVISCNLFHGTNLERTEIIAATSFDN